MADQARFEKNVFPKMLKTSARSEMDVILLENCIGEGVMELEKDVDFHAVRWVQVFDLFGHRARSCLQVRSGHGFRCHGIT